MKTAAGTVAAFAAVSLIAGSALAQDMPSVPDFLQDGARFARDLSACADGGDEGPDGVERTLQVTEQGLFGYEIGCSFLRFLPDVDRETGEAFLWIATAACGDDSGINRPDSFALIFNDFSNTLTVQSQNEYVVAETLFHLPQTDAAETDPYEAASYLSGEYTLCPRS